MPIIFSVLLEKLRKQDDSARQDLDTVKADAVFAVEQLANIAEQIQRIVDTFQNSLKSVEVLRKRCANEENNELANLLDEAMVQYEGTLENIDELCVRLSIDLKNHSKAISNIAAFR